MMMMIIVSRWQLHWIKSKTHFRHALILFTSSSSSSWLSLILRHTMCEYKIIFKIFEVNAFNCVALLFYCKCSTFNATRMELNEQQTQWTCVCMNSSVLYNNNDTCIQAEIHLNMLHKALNIKLAINGQAHKINDASKHDFQRCCCCCCCGFSLLALYLHFALWQWQW